MVYHTDTFGFVVSQGVMVEAYTTHLVTKERDRKEADWDSSL